MSKHTRVFFIPIERIPDLLSGRARVTNLPADAKCLAACGVMRNGIGIRVDSVKYKPVPEGEQIPVIVAAIEKTKEATNA